MSRELTDAEYAQAVSLCHSVVEAAMSDDGGPTVAGHFLGRLRDLLPPRPEIPQDHPVSSASGTGTSREGQTAASVRPGAGNAAVPATWWSRSAGEWFTEDADDGICSFGTFRSLSDSLPSDAQRLVPVGPLLELVEKFNDRAHYHQVGVIRGQYAATRAMDEGSQIACASAADQLRALLASLLGTPDPTTRQGGGND